MMLPRVSVPMEKPTKPAAVADAEPALEPLEPCLVFQGFLVGPPNQMLSMANAPIESLATITAPAAFSRSTTAASKSGT